jgi:mannose-6-phosphate isomerase-like protein (cupin superfamily)
MDKSSQQQQLPVGRVSHDPDATAPDGSEVRFLVDQRHAAQQASLVEVTLPAGQVSRPVWHWTVEEIWYFLEGTGQVWRCPPGADAESVAAELVNPGDALTIPTGWRFQFSANEGGPLRFLCYTSPPWQGPEEAQQEGRGGLGQATV